ncbi:ribonuclease R [Atopobacter phocae]|uniref:ribonuclease R n=1 Tax=Atopobacter phocae TaxID=136492 RepID=UPI00046F3E31|nr:ribonuclease R [Atopobacter phocae]
MKLTYNTLKEWFEQTNGSYFVNQISEVFEVQSSASFKRLVKILAQLEEEKYIEITSNGQFKKAVTVEMVEGSYTQNDKGFGFVRINETDPDVFIPRGAQNGAMNGDQVKVAITKGSSYVSDKGAEGEVVEILSHQLNQIVGEYEALVEPIFNQQKEKLIGKIHPMNKKVANFNCFVKEGGLKVVNGTIVAMEITTYPTTKTPKYLDGLITKEIGYKNQPGVDILSVLLEHHIPTTFANEVMKEVQEIPQTVLDEEIGERVDLRHLPIITIDGADAKDLDDAIYLEKLDDGRLKLGVYIADVSHYVKEGSAIDQEALERGTSVYVTDRVVPMLPTQLSNGICSLHPNVDRLVLGCEMYFTADYQLVDYRLVEAVIRSKYRMTYDDVNDIFKRSNPALLEQYAEVVPMLDLMRVLHEALMQDRYQRGAIDFETSEAKIQLDEQGFPIAIIKRTRFIAERLIESFMLAANETVARHFSQLELPFIYRIHEEPTVEKMLQFRQFIQSFGLSLPDSDVLHPKELQDLLQEIKNDRFEPIISNMMLRSMKQAKYSEEPGGHFGLASEDYTHFTSPIRRYPDLIVHRMIRFYGFMNQPVIEDTEKERLTDQIANIAMHTSMAERRAVDAERETDRMKEAEYMAGHIGEVFDGVISSVTRFGFFVELENTIEGLVHMNTLDDDYYHFMDRRMVLIGERTGVQHRLGDKVQVEITQSNKETRTIDFKLIENYTWTADRTTSVVKRKKNKKRSKKPANKKTANKKPSKTLKLAVKDKASSKTKSVKKKKRMKRQKKLK